MKISRNIAEKIRSIFKKKEEVIQNPDEILKMCGENNLDLMDALKCHEMWCTQNSQLPSEYHSLPPEIRRELYMMGMPRKK